MRAGTRELMNEDGAPLSSQQCLGFLADLPSDHIYVAFFFDYDVTMMVRDMPLDRLDRLLHREKRIVKNQPGACYAVDWAGFQLDYLPGKEFKVRRKLSDKKYGPWTVVSDTGSFFQCSFVAALKRWFGPDTEYGPVIEKIAEGKAERANFGGVTSYMRAYCKLECEMLVRLMDKIRELSYSLNIRPRAWQGPGNMVSAIMEREGFAKNRDIELWDTFVGKQVLELGNAAYYGGRFEANIIGDIAGPIYQYDINSAYASVYKHLPCLVHGKWRPIRNGIPSSDGLWVGRVSFTHRPNVFSCGLPVRLPSGTISFPRNGQGVYWSHEIRATEPHLDGWILHSGFEYVSRCACNTFDWVYNLYEERQKLGKDGKGMILKIPLAATYGKLCQSVGSAPYANPIWASGITSMIRAQLYSAMAMGDGEYPCYDVIMAATDGIFTVNRRCGLDLGSELGQWTETVHDSMFVVQSGVYFLPGKTPKTRGTPSVKIQEAEATFRERWRNYLPYLEKGWPGDESLNPCTVDIRVNNFISASLALARNRSETAGTWVTNTRTIAFDWTQKRRISYLDDADVFVKPSVNASHLLTFPPMGHMDYPNAQYKRPIGGVIQRARLDRVEEERLESDTQPDWNF
jgi:hypothetical protein